ncbi:MAG: single-stranded DNA-binding protein [Candidatus Marinimicrobia bacterium]|nr:single-stranded DNA-binding protein [Candidatus Neomarinimicrobiota bacterium]|tara:strand:+ start:10785 stop:11189 length:405 start_codon:yes stop_codon:yes gene_type:complete
MQKGSVNRVMLVGHLGGDPESRYTQSGTAVANFNVATNESRKNAEGNYQDHTEWHRCVLFGKPAETAAQYLKKGQMVYIEGRLRTRSWEDKDGNKRSTTEIQGDMFTMLGRRADNASGNSPATPDSDSDDDLPF